MHITVLSTYPSADPRHGGQHRLANIIAELERGGHEVASIGILGSENYSATAGFLPFPGYKALERQLRNPFLMEDWAIGRLAVNDPGTYRRLTGMIPKKTSLILCEQPWLWAAAAKFSRNRIFRKVPLVYGSQNVESELKYQIVRAYYDQAHAEDCLRRVLELETEAAREADLIFSVSESDAQWLKTRSKAPIIIAPNGVREDRASISDVAAANAITGNVKFALYAASSHPPNVLGFYEIFRNGVGCFPLGTKMVVAGSAGTAIRQDKLFDSSAGLAKCFVDAGSLTDSELRGLLQCAHCIFLPLTSGGGTNLKTAEALWTGRRVVATKIAMRGFERFEKATGVHIASSTSEFLTDLRKAMTSPRFEISEHERQARRPLLWTETLRPMLEAVEEMVP